MTRLVVTGLKGQVALSLLDRAPAFTGIEVVPLGRPQLDLERTDEVRAALATARPDLIVNAAAYTAVDKAESEEALAMTINRDGAGVVAAAAQSLGVPLVQLSTDYVYDGRKGAPYVETDATAPLNAYGRSKLAGEKAARVACPDTLVLRTAWIYSPFGNNFVKTMLRLAAEKPVLRVVDDQWGNPTSALDLAHVLLQVSPNIVKGTGSRRVLHLAGLGHTTWCRFARELFQVLSPHGAKPTIEPISTSEYPMSAQRPLDTRLDLASIQACYDIQLRGWQHGLKHVLAHLASNT